MGLGIWVFFSSWEKYNSTGWRGDLVSHDFSLKLWNVFSFWVGVGSCRQGISTLGDQMFWWIHCFSSPSLLFVSFCDYNLTTFRITLVIILPFKNLEKQWSFRLWDLCINIFNKRCLFFILQEHKPITSEFACLLCLLCSVRSTLNCLFLLYRSLHWFFL